MRIGLQIPNFTWPGGKRGIRTTLAEIAKTAEDAGFYSLWVMDHFFQLEFIGPPELEMLEGYSTLTYLAGLTKRVRLGTLVTGVIYRYPGILVKTVSTLDVLSGGRAYLGIGAAWFEREAVGLGVPFPPLKERFERLEETLQITKQMLSTNNGPYAGRHYQLAETINSPQPITAPHPPIMIGGMGEQKTLRMVAQYGDACNLFLRPGYEVLEKKLDVLQKHCQDVGRAFDEIECTTLGTANLGEGGLSPDDILETCRRLADLGIDHAIFNMRNVHEITPLEVFGREIIPAAAEL